MVRSKAHPHCDVLLQAGEEAAELVHHGLSLFPLFLCLSRSRPRAHVLAHVLAHGSAVRPLDLALLQWPSPFPEPLAHKVKLPENGSEMPQLYESLPLLLFIYFLTGPRPGCRPPGFVESPGTRAGHWQNVH